MVYIKYVYEHMILVKMKLENTQMNVISLYAPEITKSKEDKFIFYEHHYDLFDTTTANAIRSQYSNRKLIKTRRETDSKKISSMKMKKGL